MSELVFSLYPSALDCGISPGQFWDLSLLEITDLMESYGRREIRQIKQDIVSKHFLAKDIGQYTALVIQGGDNMNPSELWDFFPDLFAEERVEGERQRAKRQLAVYKAQMEDFMHQHNHRRKDGGGK